MDEKTYLVRINIHDEVNYIDTFYENDQIAICIGDDELNAWENHDKKTESKEKKQFIERWFKLQNEINDNDVIVLATYLNKPFAKIGKIIKGTNFEVFSKNERYKFFQLEKETVRTFNLIDYPVFSSIIPSQVTISPIKKRDAVIRAIYNGNLHELPITIGNVSEKLIELMCVEWLRSDLSNDYKLKYQLLLTGGNYRDIDVLGITINKKCLAAQVSDTSDENLIESKIKKLNNLKSDIKIMFCQNFSKNSGEIKIIHLQKVWDELKLNGYKEMLESFVRL